MQDASVSDVAPQAPEEWRECVGFDGAYWVSNMGRVKSFLVDKNCGKILRQWKGAQCVYNGSRYRAVVLRKEGRSFTRPIHRLVAEAFIPNPRGLPEVNHKNGDRADNKVENLEWVTHRENMIHSHRTLGRGMDKAFGTKAIRVKCLNTGEEFRSLRGACIAKKIDRKALFLCLKGLRNSVKGLQWAYI